MASRSPTEVTTNLSANTIAESLPGGNLREYLITSKGERRAEVVTTSQVSRAWLYGASLMISSGALLQSGPLFGLGLLLAAALGISWVWTRWCLANLTVERRFSHHRAFWGEEVDVAQVFTNAKALPLPWLSVVDEFPGSLKVLHGSDDASVQLVTRRVDTTLTLGWYERVIRHYKVICTARGEHQFGPVDVSAGDVFGLFRRTETFETPETLLVYPRYVPVERLGIPARQPFGDFKAVLNLATDPLRMRAVREYAYGDNPRFIHWKATARRGVMQTKLFEPAATPQLLIFCNQHTFSRFWEGINTSTLELTITVVASLANHALQEGYMVGVQVNAFEQSADRHLSISPSRNPGQLTRILESLARLKGWSGQPMEDLIEAQRRALPIASTIVVVTGVVTDDMLNVLTALRRAGHPVTLVETASPTQRKPEQGVSPDALRAQGIIYYLVNTIGLATDIEELSFQMRG